MNMNVFRILGDVSHTASKCILIWAIHNNKSAEGVSLITQMLYIVVFLSRYLDIFWTPPQLYLWNFVLKIFYISSSIYIIILMTRVYARTREREKGWRLGGYAAGGSLILGPIVTLIFKRWGGSTPYQVWFKTPSSHLDRCAALANRCLARCSGHSLSSSNLSASCHNCFCFVKPPFLP